MDRQTRLTVYYVVLVVTVLSGVVVLYNYGMATGDGRPQPLYRSIEAVEIDEDFDIAEFPSRAGAN